MILGLTHLRPLVREVTAVCWLFTSLVGEAVAMEEPHVSLCFSAYRLNNRCSAFTMASKQRESGKRRCVNLCIGE